jgi:hypothetical protein
MIGARDLGVGLGLQVALDRDAPTRGWLEASAVVDGIDAAACLLARHHLRPASSPAPSAWRRPERCSVPGWQGNSTPHPVRPHGIRASERTAVPREGSVRR